jgi:hypothetical protein
MGYKIVKPDLTSAFATGRRAVTYKIGEFVKVAYPYANYHLTYFPKLRDARRFFGKELGVELWEASVRGKLLRLPPFLLFSLTKDPMLDPPPDGCTWPRGTAMAKEIKLIRRIL